MKKLYKIEFYVPESHLENVKNALFSAGAGSIGHYNCCCWETPGTGQFCPLEGSTPYKGEIDTIKKVKEYKVEIVCAEKFLEAAIKTLKTSHPYETPAFSFWQINTPSS